MKSPGSRQATTHGARDSSVANRLPPIILPYLVKRRDRVGHGERRIQQPEPQSQAPLLIILLLIRILSFYNGVGTFSRNPVQVYSRNDRSPDVRQTSRSDYVRVNELALNVSFSDGSRWPSGVPTPQPILVSFSFAHDVRNAAATDDLAHSVNYSTLASGMKAIVDSEVFPSLEGFVDRVCQVYASHYSAVPTFTVRIARTKTLLYGAAFGLEVTKLGRPRTPVEETFFFRDIVAYAVIGIHAHERQRKQRVRVNTSITRRPTRQQPLDFRTLEQRIFDVRIVLCVDNR